MAIEKSESFQSWRYENGPLRKSFPSDLVSEVPKPKSEDELQSTFLLTLALAFNNIKGLIIIYDTMNSVYDVNGTPREVNGNVGEQQGMILQMQSLLFASIFEVLVFIKSKNSQKVYQSDYIQSLLRDISQSTRLVWEILDKVSREQPVNDERFSGLNPSVKFLEQIRNNVGFHLQTDSRLIQGYRKYFFEGVKISKSIPGSDEWALRSATLSKFDQSRYYYADAALQGYYINLFGGEKDVTKCTKDILELTGMILRAVNELLIEHHKRLPNR